MPTTDKEVKGKQFKKAVTIFEVLNEMPDGSISLFYHQAGGHTIGRAKDKRAVIEVLVDDETFQDFAFQKTYGAAKKGHKKKVFVMISFDLEEYKSIRTKISTK